MGPWHCTTLCMSCFVEDVMLPYDGLYAALTLAQQVYHCTVLLLLLLLLRSF